LLDLIVKLSKEEGITVLFSSHHLQQVQQVCDRVGLFVRGKLLAEGDINTLSRKLFSDSAYVVEAGISSHFPGISDSGALSETDPLIEKIKTIDGVKAVRMTDKMLSIECTLDITPVIAKAIIDSGAGLNYLNKKEYGLDDIYFRYFEGDKNHV